MLKNITIGQYFPGDSALHKADPRTKIILTLIFMIAILMVNTVTGLAMFALFTVIVVIVSTVPVSFIIKGLKPVLYILLFTTILNIFFSRKGTPLFEYGIIHIYYEGVKTALEVAVRITLLITGASVLTLTTTPIMLTDAIEKLMNPMKRIGIPVHEIAMMMTIALRFIPTLLEETDKIMKAQAARGADFDTGNMVQRAKSFLPVLVPLFISAFRRAEELAIAMESRCYRGSIGRTRMKQLKYTKIDAVISVVLLIFILPTLYIQFM